MSAGFECIELVQVDAVAIDETRDHLRQMGRKGLEGLALWVGQANGATFTVKGALIPRQTGSSSDHGLLVQVDGDELHRINVELYKREWRVIAQIHSHPGAAYHSSTDDRYAIATTLGAFSIVVPDFAEGPFRVSEFATYRLSHNMFGFSPRWRKVGAKRAQQIFDGSFDDGLG